MDQSTQFEAFADVREAAKLLGLSTVRFRLRGSGC